MVSTSFSLLERVRRTDQAAWEQFVTLYTPLLYHWSQQAGFAVQDAADLVQEVFAVLVAELPTFEYDAAKGSFRGWLKTITVNKCRERQRRKVLDVATGGDHLIDSLPDDDALEALWDAEYRRYLLRKSLEVMRRHFEPKTWRAAWEHVAHGRSAAEVGQMLGMSEAAVYVAKFRVIRRLRRELQGLLD